jgi:hypothetical protein
LKGRSCCQSYMQSRHAEMEDMDRQSNGQGRNLTLSPQ